MILVNVKLDINEYKGIIFQGSRPNQSFLMPQVMKLAILAFLCCEKFFKKLCCGTGCCAVHCQQLRQRNALHSNQCHNNPYELVGSEERPKAHMSYYTSTKS